MTAADRRWTIARQTIGQFARWAAALALLLSMSLWLSGCATVGYLSQAGRGQLEILTRAQPVERVIANPRTGPDLRHKLQLTQELRAYAASRLSLDVGRQYQSYADLGRDSAVYSVVVAYPFALKTRDFCFPVAGCVPYRGYFDEGSAQAEAARWQAQGFDVVVGHVDAFSTLGYLPDPLLNTFIDDSDLGLAELIFHELVHATVYVPGDVVFNESLATAFEQIALERWMVDSNRTALRAELAERTRAKQLFNDVITHARSLLERTYAGRYRDDSARAAAKQQALRAAQQYYLARKPELGGRSYDGFILAPDFNNAKLMAVGVYDDLVPAFLALYRRTGSSPAAFFDAVRALARRDKASRDRYLGQLQ